MIQTFHVFTCWNLEKHTDEKAVQMKVINLLQDIWNLDCPECGSAIRVDTTVMQGHLLTSIDEDVQ